MGCTVATKSDEVLGKLFEMINTGNFSFWFHSKSPITVDNLYKDGGLFKNTEIDETKKGREAAYDSLLEWFAQKQLIIGDNLKNNEYEGLLVEIIDARTIIDKYVTDLDDNDKFFFIEFMLWGLESFNKLSILRTNNGIEFKDPFNNFINKI